MQGLVRGRSRFESGCRQLGFRRLGSIGCSIGRGTGKTRNEERRNGKVTGDA